MLLVLIEKRALHVYIVLVYPNMKFLVVVNISRRCIRQNIRKNHEFHKATTRLGAGYPAKVYAHTELNLTLH